MRELSWADFDRAVQELARTIDQSFKAQAVVGVAHGGVFVGGALSSALGCEFFPVRISRRSRDRSSPKKPQVAGDMPRELKGAASSLWTTWRPAATRWSWPPRWRTRRGLAR